MDALELRHALGPLPESLRTELIEGEVDPWGIVQSLWANLGWAPIAGAVTYTDPDLERRRWPLVAMSRPLGEDPWPTGEVDLGGLPF